jgi:hypothetical protein
MLTILKYKCKGKVGKRFGTPIWDPDLGPRFMDPDMGPRFGTRFGTLIWDPDLGPDLGP